MVSKKYAEDYRLENGVDGRGRPVKKAVYVGPYFTHTEKTAAVAFSKKLCLPVCMVLWGIFALCFVQNGAAARQWWVSLLYLVTLLPLVLLTWASITLSLARPPFDRETSDDLSGKYPKAALALAAFAGAAALAGGAVCLFTQTFELPGDLLYLGGNAVTALLGLWLYSRRKSFETREVSRSSEEFLRLMAEKESKK